MDLTSVTFSESENVPGFEAQNDDNMDMDLASMDEAYKAAEAKTFDDVPDGVYQTKLVEFTFGKSTTNNTPKVGFKLEVIQGKFAGKYIFKSFMLPTRADDPEKVAQKLGFLKGALETIGWNNSLSKIQEENQRAAFIGVYLQVKVSTYKNDKGEQKSIAIQKKLTPVNANTMPNLGLPSAAAMPKPVISAAETKVKEILNTKAASKAEAEASSEFSQDELPIPMA